ncbi:MAG: cation:proton antiporter [Syntrophorhabdaceae bacterium]|nr:cation:proton antiporter [Syntrophorhabdaceae bacterium]
MHDAPEFLTSLAVVFSVAGITTVVFQKLRQPVIFGYLVAGMIVGPHIPIPLVANPNIVQTLSELGVILLMFYIGLEFRLSKLIQIGPTSGVVALLQCSFMLWLGYELARMLGCSSLESFYAGAALCISSTVIIGAAFLEQGIKGKLSETVFGILIVEDLIAIFLLTILTAVSSGNSLSAKELAITGGRLTLFLAVLLIVGMLTVPRLLRTAVRLNRPETTLVASVGVCFACALLAHSFGYSVALGAFIAGALVAESGLEKTVAASVGVCFACALLAHSFGYSVALGAFIAGALVAESGLEKTVAKTVKPMCDGFAAVFFVSVGMLIDPLLIARHWVPVVVFLTLILAGNMIGITLWSFLAGHGIHTSIRAGMSMAQIGEFSFIIASLGLATGATRGFLFPVTVAVSAITTLLNPWLIRWSEPTADRINRLLPKAVHTFAALYDAWLERTRRATETAQAVRQRRRQILLLLFDIILLAGLLAGASRLEERISVLLASVSGLPVATARNLFLTAIVVFSAILCYSIYRGMRQLVVLLVNIAFPAAGAGRVDLAATPRRTMIVALELVALLVISMPLLALLQPFLPKFPGAVFLLLALVLFGISLWRRAANLEGHVKAVSQVIVESMLSQSGTEGSDKEEEALQQARKLFPGLGHLAPLRLQGNNYCVGKTMGEVNIGNLTGAKVLVILRGEGNSILPTGREILMEGDLLTLAGAPEAVKEAREILIRGR